MAYDQFGQMHVTQDNLFNMLYEYPELDLKQFQVDDPNTYNHSVQVTHCDFPLLQQYRKLDIDVDTFDTQNQDSWFMPDEYRNMDIAKWVLEQCQTPAELQRTGTELLLFQEKNLFSLLCYLKYLVDTMRKNRVLWGVGRGSSVASYVLYLIGVHRINSLYYDLPIDEFLKEDK
jgi:DNA polymerase III alpha subunit